METGTLPRKSARMLAIFCSIQWPLKLPRKCSPKLRSRGLYIHMKPLRNIGTRLNSNGGDVGVSLDASLHRGGGFRAVTTGPRAPTHYLSSLALDSACPLG